MKKMFLSFLMPYPIRNTEAPYLWIFYKQLTSFKSDEIIFIGSNEYKKEPFSFKNRFELKQESIDFNNYKIPTIEKINKYLFYEFPEEIFSDLNIKYQFNSNRIFADLLTKEILGIEIYLDKLMAEITKSYNIVSLLSWSNFPSLSKISAKYNIPIIHNELGALRKPNYLSMAYFDFSGVNGNTESKSRFISFKQCYSKEEIYSLDRIKNIIFNVDFKFDEIIEMYDVGIALQVEDDSNILAYSNGFDSISLIRWVSNAYKSTNILIREHPSSYLSYKKFGNIDFSENSFSFISKCKEIVTINSSVALEALLLEKVVKILGDSPFSFIMELDNSEKILALNFVLFGYMIPYELLFNYDYYIWRLSTPSEKEIFNKHVNFYEQKIKNRVKEEVKIKDSCSSFIQLFIENKNYFSEENSIKFPVILNNEIQKFEFDLKDKNSIKFLRLDPFNDSCVIEIEKLNIILNDGSQIDLIPHISANVCSNHAKSYFFEFFDPQIYFENIDFEKLDSIEKLCFEVKYSHISKDAVHVCANQIATDKNYQISIIEKEKIELQESLNSMENKASNLEKEKIELQESLNSMENKASNLEKEKMELQESLNSMENKASNLEKEKIELQESLNSMENKASNLEKEKMELQESLNSMENKASNFEKEKMELQERLSSMENKASNLENELLDIYTSKSWKITRQLRNLKKGKL